MDAADRLELRHSQNFLTDPALIDRLLDASTIGPHDLVYEIGPGRGAITERLLYRCGRVVAVEMDPLLVRRLARRFAGCPRLDLRQGDALYDPLPRQPYKVFASIPFAQTAAIVRRLAGATPPPEDQYLVVQREAAQRFCGRPRTTLPALLLSPWFEARIVYTFRRGDFSPRPGVDVVLLRLAKRGPPLLPVQQGRLYRDFVSAVFTCRRPSLVETLRRLGGDRWARRALAEAGVPWQAWPSDVPPERWLRLFAAFRRGADAAALARVRGAEAGLQRQQARLQKWHRSRGRATGPGPPAPCRWRRAIRRRGAPDQAENDTPFRVHSTQRVPGAATIAVT